jgi:hypothetical protein
MVVQRVNVGAVRDPEPEVLRPALADRHAGVARGGHGGLEALHEYLRELRLTVGEQRTRGRDVRRGPQNPGGEIRRTAVAVGLLTYDHRQPTGGRGRTGGQPRLPTAYDQQVDHVPSPLT